MGWDPFMTLSYSLPFENHIGADHELGPVQTGPVLSAAYKVASSRI